MDPVIHLTPYHDVLMRPIRAVHRIFAEFVTLDDLMSEAAVWWYGPGQAHLEKYLDEESDYVLLRRSIWRHCARYAEKEKAQYSGYEPMDQVRYSVREVLAVLPVALNPDGTPGGGGGPRSGPAPKGNLAERGDALASLMDVRRALESLAEDDVHFLHLAEDLRHDWEKVVSLMGAEIQPDTARRRHARIAARMTRYLNTYQETAA